MKHSVTGWRRVVSQLLFILYLIALSYLLFFSEAYGRTGTMETYHYNLVLFREIKRFYHYRALIGMKGVLINLVGNVAAFVPFGFFLPLLQPKMARFFLIFCGTFLFSLAIECIQLVYRVGTFDVDDLFLNTLGGILGYFLLRIFYFIRGRRETWKK